MSDSDLLTVAEAEIERLQARVKSLEADVEHLTYANMQMAPQLVRLRARNKELREGADTPSATQEGG